MIDDAIKLSRRRDRLERIKVAIQAAFADVRLGSGVGLREAQAIDDYETTVTRAACRGTDEKLDWRRIPVKDLNECNSSLSFFDAEGMRFHLPGFMIADLNGDYRFGMAFCLTQCPDERFALLNKAQAGVVREYLRFIEEEPDYEFERDHIRRALDEFWLQK